MGRYCHSTLDPRWCVMGKDVFVGGGVLRGSIYLAMLHCPFSDSPYVVMLCTCTMMRSAMIFVNLDFLLDFDSPLLLGEVRRLRRRFSVNRTYGIMGCSVWCTLEARWLSAWIVHSFAGVENWVLVYSGRLTFHSTQGLRLLFSLRSTWVRRLSFSQISKSPPSGLSLFATPHNNQPQAGPLRYHPAPP